MFCVLPLKSGFIFIIYGFARFANKRKTAACAVLSLMPLVPLPDVRDSSFPSAVRTALP